MPNVIVHGRQPHVRGCAMCHMPNGKGRPENAPVVGQPVAYFVQQLHDFKNGLRTSADPRKMNTQQMIEGAQDMTEDEIQESAKYFGSMKWTHWITVKEAATVPKTRITGNVFFPLSGGEMEPIGNRIIEMPEDGDRFELRDPHSSFIAYVPPGSIDKGSLIASSGGGKSFACRTCHGHDLMGLVPVPGIDGRSTSYLIRRLWDFPTGTRHVAWSQLMQQAVKDLSQEDLLNLAAYLAAAGPADSPK
jgi:cytochrome c553